MPCTKYRLKPAVIAMEATVPRSAPRLLVQQGNWGTEGLMLSEWGGMVEGGGEGGRHTGEAH